MTRAITRPATASRNAVTALPTLIAQRIVTVLARHEPTLLGRLVEVGVIDRAFVEQPGQARIVTASPLEMLERTLASVLERRPSLLPALGMSAIDVISAAHELTDGSTVPSRRAVVAFTDLAGFTDFTRRRGDEAAARVLVRHYRTAGKIVRSRRGRIAKRLGDGLMLTFREPIDGVRALVELRDRTGDPLPVRAGIHAGPVLRQGRDVFGHTVNVAARVSNVARAGEILVSTDVADLLRQTDSDHVQLRRCRRRQSVADGDRYAVHPVESV